MYRKVDRGSNLVMSSHSTGEIYVVGEDKILKQYDQPADLWAAIEFKKPPAAPVKEMPSHSIATTCWDVSKEFKQFATGGKDGVIMIRNVGKFETANEIRAHTLFTGGVTAIAFSNTRSTLYTAGGDGSFMAWTIGGKPNPS